MSGLSAVHVSGRVIGQRKLTHDGTTGQGNVKSGYPGCKKATRRQSLVPNTGRRVSGHKRDMMMTVIRRW